MTELGLDKSLFWPNWVTINTQRSLNRSQGPNSVTGCPNSVPPYNQINQVGLQNYFYRYRYVFTRVTSEFMGRWKSKNIRQIRMLMGDKFVSKTRIPAVFRGFWATFVHIRLKWVILRMLRWHCRQDTGFKRPDAEHATSRSRRFPTILNLYECARKKHFVSSKLEGQNWVRTCDPRFSKQTALTTAPGPRICRKGVIQKVQSEVKKTSWV